MRAPIRAPPSHPSEWLVGGKWLRLSITSTHSSTAVGANQVSDLAHCRCRTTSYPRPFLRQLTWSILCRSSLSTRKHIRWMGSEDRSLSEVRSNVYALTRRAVMSRMLAQCLGLGAILGPFESIVSVFLSVPSLFKNAVGGWKL